MCLYTALSMSFPFQCPAFPPGCKGQPPEPVLRGFHTTGPEPIHVPGGHTTLPGCGRWSRPPTECVSTPSPRGAIRNLTQRTERCPWKALGSSKCGTRRSASARSWRPSKRDIPFLSINLAKICETTVLACCIPAFLDKLKNPAYTYNVGRVSGKEDVLSLGHPICFKNRKSLPDSPSLIKAKLILPAQLLHQVHGECLATAWMFHEP